MDLDDVCVCTSPRTQCTVIHYYSIHTGTPRSVCLSVIVVPGYTGEHVCSVCAAHTHQGVRTPIPNTLVVRRLTRNQLRQHSRPVLHGY